MLSCYVLFCHGILGDVMLCCVVLCYVGACDGMMRVACLVAQLSTLSYYDMV